MIRICKITDLETCFEAMDFIDENFGIEPFMNGKWCQGKGFYSVYIEDTIDQDVNVIKFAVGKKFKTLI